MKTKFSNVKYDPATTHIKEFNGWDIHSFRTIPERDEMPKFSGFCIHTKTGRYLDTPFKTEKREDIIENFMAAIESGTISAKASDEKHKPAKPEFMARTKTPSGIIV